MNSTSLLELLGRLQRGELTPDEVARQLAPATPLAQDTGAAQVDLDRAQRCGFPEVVYCPGKTSAAIVGIFHALQDHQQDCFATRASPEQARDLLEAFPAACYNPTARTIRLDVAGGAEPEDRRSAGHVAVVTAGTGDLPVAEEAVETLRWMRCSTDLIVDVGVAGPHRLPSQRHRLVDADAVVVVAGMEGALPSVVGGYVACPVIAVPTSIGYGASFGGVAALLGMLNSCAANVTVVNIDAGFKAGFVAGLIARRRKSGLRQPGA